VLPGEGTPQRESQGELFSRHLLYDLPLGWVTLIKQDGRMQVAVPCMAINHHRQTVLGADVLQPAYSLWDSTARHGDIFTQLVWCAPRQRRGYRAPRPPQIGALALALRQVNLARPTNPAQTVDLLTLTLYGSLIGAVAFDQQNSFYIQWQSQMYGFLNASNGRFIHHLDSRRYDPRCQDSIDSTHGIIQLWEFHQGSASKLGFGSQPQQRFGDDTQRALRSGKEGI